MREIDKLVRKKQAHQDPLHRHETVTHKMPQWRHSRLRGVSHSS